ncbi:MAG TPA: DUF4097 family beta strand repeat-containing protein [Chitinophagaceae bacterium]|nr:DUF4097 family beta strand repeat-containing protein [Chitinophagaceae bacterium]
MKKVFFALFISCITIPVLSQQTIYLTKSLTGEPVNNVEAKTSGGSIDVSGDHAQDARIEVYVSPNRGNRTLSKEEIDARISEDYDFSVDVSGGKLTLIALPRHNFRDWKKALNISFKIFVPQDVSTDLSTSGGSIALSNLSGTEEFRTSGGGLTVEKLSGKINGETSGGSIKVADSKDDIDLSTSGGGIDADNCTGTIRLSTSGGSIKLHELRGDIKAATSGGSVHAANIGGDLAASTSGGSLDLRALSCSVDASTSGGNIDVEIANVGKYVKLSNSGGHINLTIPKDKGYDLKLYANRMDRNFSLSNFSGTVKDDKIEGTINGGGIPVTADASGGKINLSFE